MPRNDSLKAGLRMPSTPLPYDSRAIGQEVLRRLAEIDDLQSEEHLRKLATNAQQCVDERRLAVLRASVPALTRVADVAARTEHNELLADALRKEV